MTRPSTAIGVAALVFIGAIATAQSQSGGLGTALPGITLAEFEEFRLGLDDFLAVEATEEELGPAFNGTSCAACHNVPVIGGGGIMAEMRAGRRNAQGDFEALDPSGETLFHLFSVPGHGCQPIVPPEATVFARRVPIPLFGAGLVEAIPNETLRALEDPTDRAAAPAVAARRIRRHGGGSGAAAWGRSGARPARLRAALRGGARRAARVSQVALRGRVADT